MMLNLSMSDQLQSFVEQQATDAGFESASDYVLYLIRQEQQRVRVPGQEPSDDRQFSEGDASRTGVDHRQGSSTADPLLLMQLPLVQRRQALAAQAAAIASHYEADQDWREFTAGDFIEYP
jgi:Arc/MetJ-type ribon-helix-helix transcriptional regulator